MGCILDIGFWRHFKVPWKLVVEFLRPEGYHFGGHPRSKKHEKGEPRIVQTKRFMWSGSNRENRTISPGSPRARREFMTWCFAAWMLCCRVAVMHCCMDAGNYWVMDPWFIEPLMEWLNHGCTEAWMHCSIDCCIEALIFWSTGSVKHWVMEQGSTDAMKHWVMQALIDLLIYGLTLIGIKSYMLMLIYGYVIILRCRWMIHGHLEAE